MLERARSVAALGVAIIVITAVPGGVSASAQTPAVARGRRAAVAQMRHPLRQVVASLRGLGLTADQRQQIKGILKKHQPELKALAEKARAARQAWQQSGQISIQERRDLMAQRAAILQAVRTDVLGVLTPEQRNKVEARRRRL